MRVTRTYYSQRQGFRRTDVSFTQLRQVVDGLYDDWDRAGLFQQWFGYDCVDAGVVPGKAGAHPDAYVFRETLSDRLWPVPQYILTWSESELFDGIEFMWEHASAGVDEHSYHSWNNCGYHFSKFDQRAGRDRLRRELNPVLALYSPGYELTKEGEVSAILKPHIAQLVEMPLPTESPAEVRRAIHRAVHLYRHRSSGKDEWREAARELADAFEFLRDQTRMVLAGKDDDLIFELANRFHVRHSKSGQISQYDPRWLRWIIEFYLSTLFLCFDLLGWAASPVMLEPEAPAAEPRIPDSAIFDPDEIPF